jgi:hypothetical protein
MRGAVLHELSWLQVGGGRILPMSYGVLNNHAEELQDGRGLMEWFAIKVPRGHKQLE